ncbi:E3 ubiquitin-protein ligase rnf168 [Sphaeramia orbicularis]|uniref:RING-type E3 ubiquitin transferase n=1 Tax=Sphaeramia orbicularis TaxID=375764 RepID=A0A673C796_9TELE|nr:E3 ubiquitin-protein ligase RNF168 [Sphaeramia orbicularis]XP_030007146.1 E3 ubiquitin-protein ligase RNF168 [Sphaeramia orbicularis]XP_030007147.1 E3 ubiquitin-protein ligase RNF168 [Sphaeramia orbicularis]
MAPVSDVEVERGRGRSGGQPLSREDCLCPVCLEIYMEPVTLPCTHTFCKACFLESVDKATLCCPMCRRRVSTWARQNSRNKTLVNERLWRQIQTAFPLECQRRISGQDGDTDDAVGVPVSFHKVSQPGELRQEFEDQITKLTEEKRVQDEEQRRASEEYIQKLLAEEEEELQEERRRREEDERLARLISQQLNSVPVSQENLRPDVTAAKKKEKMNAGQIDKYLCPVQCRSSDSSPTSSFMANKENILLSQVKPPSERPLPRLDYYGPQTQRHDRQTDQSGASTPPLPSEEPRGVGALKRKTEDEGGATSKRGCPSSASSSAAAGGTVLNSIAELEAELQSRRRQEEEDRRLALILQKELDQEERQRATDRSKGSADAYHLRQARNTPKTPPTTAKRTARTSTATPSSSAQRKTSSSTSGSSSSGRQTTLTDMFTFSS